MTYDTVGGDYEKIEYKKPYTIGDLLQELDNSPANSVRLLGTNYTLGTLMSWRGAYDHPAFDYLVEHKSPSQLASEIRYSLQQEHTGYKGGEYWYYPEDEFYVSAYGQASEYKIVDVKTEQSILYLCTKIVPY